MKHYQNNASNKWITEERDFLDRVNTKQIEIGQLIWPCNKILNWIGEIVNM